MKIFSSKFHLYSGLPEQIVLVGTPWQQRLRCWLVDDLCDMVVNLIFSDV